MPKMKDLDDFAMSVNPIVDLEGSMKQFAYPWPPGDPDTDVRKGLEYLYAID